VTRSIQPTDRSHTPCAARRRGERHGPLGPTHAEWDNLRTLIAATDTPAQRAESAFYGARLDEAQVGGRFCVVDMSLTQVPRREQPQRAASTRGSTQVTWATPASGALWTPSREPVHNRRLPARNRRRGRFKIAPENRRSGSGQDAYQITLRSRRWPPLDDPDPPFGTS